MNTKAVEVLIEVTSTAILDEWTTEAITAGVNADSYIGDKLDELELTEPEVSVAVGATYLKRLGKRH